jgi:hypothetical protein
MWSKAPLRSISFSMAATPLSLMLQQRHPFANSRNSSVFSADGSSGDEMLIALAGGSFQKKFTMLTHLLARTFDILAKNQKMANIRIQT